MWGPYSIFIFVNRVFSHTGDRQTDRLSVDAFDAKIETHLYFWCKGPISSLSKCNHCCVFELSYPLSHTQAMTDRFLIDRFSPRFCQPSKKKKVIIQQQLWVTSVLILKDNAAVTQKHRNRLLVNRFSLKIETHLPF